MIAVIIHELNRLIISQLHYFINIAIGPFSHYWLVVRLNCFRLAQLPLRHLPLAVGCTLEVVLGASAEVILVGNYFVLRSILVETADFEFRGIFELGLSGFACCGFKIAHYGF